MLVDYRDSLVGLECDVGIEELEKSGAWGLGIGAQGSCRKELEGHTKSARRIPGPQAPTPRPTSERRSGVQGCQRFPHSLPNYFFNKELVPKPGLELGRVHVHVYGVAGEVEEQEE